MGDLRLKIEAIEAFDDKIVGTILKGMEEFPNGTRFWSSPDHPTPLSLRTHAADPVPYVIYSNESGGGAMPWEKHLMRFPQVKRIYIEKGFELIERFLSSSYPVSMLTGKREDCFGEFEDKIYLYDGGRGLLSGKGTGIGIDWSPPRAEGTESHFPQIRPLYQRGSRER